MSIPVSIASSKLIATTRDCTYSESSARCQLTVLFTVLGLAENGTVHQRKDNPETASTKPPLPPYSSIACPEHHLGRVELGTAWWMDALLAEVLSEQAGGAKSQRNEG